MKLYYIFYYNVVYELKYTGLKTKHMWVGYMIKFVILITWLSKSLHLKRYNHSSKMVSWVAVAKYVLWLCLWLQWKATTNKNVNLTSSINCLIRSAASIKGKAQGGDQSLKLRWLKFEQLLFTELLFFLCSKIPVCTLHPLVGLHPSHQTVQQQQNFTICSNSGF
jgi:hypothetical protein